MIWFVGVGLRLRVVGVCVGCRFTCWGFGLLCLWAVLYWL